MRVTYEELKEAMTKGLRNGNWRRLRKIERVFFRASMTYAKIHRHIVSEIIVGKIIAILKKIYETPSSRIFKRGFERAVKLLNETDLSFMKMWLRDPDFIFYIGVSKV